MRNGYTLVAQPIFVYRINCVWDCMFLCTYRYRDMWRNIRSLNMPTIYRRMIIIIAMRLSIYFELFYLFLSVYFNIDPNLFTDEFAYDMCGLDIYFVYQMCNYVYLLYLHIYCVAKKVSKYHNSKFWILIHTNYYFV